jgi:hypothetical protein
MKARHEFESLEDYKEYLRHYYAGLAMQGMLANPELEVNTTPAETIAEDAVVQADALISQLSI